MYRDHHDGDHDIDYKTDQKRAEYHAAVRLVAHHGGGDYRQIDRDKHHDHKKDDRDDDNDRDQQTRPKKLKAFPQIVKNHASAVDLSEITPQNAAEHRADHTVKRK